MRRIYLVVIGVTLVALLMLAALSIAWAWPAKGGVMGPWMMYGGSRYTSDGSPVTIDDAAAAAEQYLENYGQNLAIVEVMEFSRNFYVEVEERDSGIHAMELLVDKSSGRAFPEMGPNMMWNTKYGRMGGMMGMMGNYYRASTPTATMPVTPEQARKLAQQYLDTSSPSLTAGDAETFYGYYTIHTLKNGQIEGMLSVNGYSGAVWYHRWHGAFIRMEEYGQSRSSGL
jgi:hypothetical protein